LAIKNKLCTSQFFGMCASLLESTNKSSLKLTLKFLRVKNQRLCTPHSRGNCSLTLRKTSN